MLVEESAIELIRKVVQKGGSIELPAQGDSMYPIIKKGDICTFILCKPSDIQKGDIILYHSQAGNLITHRFYEQKIIKQELFYLLKGDTNLGFDQPIKERQIIGKLAIVQRQQKRISVSDFPAFIWGRLIISIPILSSLLRNYLNSNNSYQF